MKMGLWKIAFSLSAISALAAGCGGGSDDPAVDAAVTDAAVGDGGAVDGSSTDGTVDGATADARPVDAVSADAAPMRMYSGTIVVSELNFPTSATTSFEIGSTNVAWADVTKATVGLRTPANELATAPIGCFGYAFDSAATPPVLPPLDSGNAGNVTITGHLNGGANGGCTPNAVSTPATTCAPATISCTRASTAPFIYTCGGVEANGVQFPLTEFFAETGAAPITIAAAGGPDIPAFSVANIPVSGSASFDTATILAINGGPNNTPPATQKWDGTMDLVATMTPAGSGGRTQILRIEATNGTPSSTNPFPRLGQLGATKYAVLTCAQVLVGSTDSVTAPAAKIASTFSAILPTATVFRVTGIRAGVPQLAPSGGSPNTTQVGAGQGMVLQDSTPRTP